VYKLNNSNIMILRSFNVQKTGVLGLPPVPVQAGEKNEYSTGQEILNATLSVCVELSTVTPPPPRVDLDPTSGIGSKFSPRDIFTNVHACVVTSQYLTLFCDDLIL